MAENQPINEIDAEAVVPAAGVATGSVANAAVNAALQGARDLDAESLAAANQTELESIQHFLEILRRGIGDANIAHENLERLEQGGSFNYLVERLNYIEPSSQGHALFIDKDRHFAFVVTPDGVFHEDTNENVSPEEAFISAQLISLNPKAVSDGVTISGNDMQKAMYYLGLKDANPALIINNQAEIDAIPEATLQQAKQEYAAFKAQQEAELTTDIAAPEIIDEIDAALTEAPLFISARAEEERANAAKAVFTSQRPEAIAAREAQERADASLLSAEDRAALIKAATAGREVNPQVAAQQRIAADTRSAKEIMDQAGEAATHAGANRAIELGRTPRTMYKALTAHIQETGVATNKSIRAFLEEQGVPSNRLSKVTKDAISRINKEDFITLERKGNSPVYNRIVNVRADFEAASAPTGKPTPLVLTAAQRVTSEQGDFNAASHDVPKIINEDPGAGLRRTLARIPPPSA